VESLVLKQNRASGYCGVLSLAIFLAAYLSVALEDRLGSFRKSMPVCVAAGAIWMLASLSSG